MYTLEKFGIQYGYEKLAPTTAKGITETNITPASGIWKGRVPKAAVVKALSYPVNFRCDGTNPTANDGMQIGAGDYWEIVGYQNIRNFRCIDTAAGASDVRVLLYF